MSTVSKNKVKCSVSGLVFGVTSQTRAKRIARYGSEEAYESQYVSRIAKSLLKEGKTPQEIKAMADRGEITATTVSKGDKVARAVKTPKAKKEKAAKTTEASTPDIEAEEDVKEFLK